MTKFEVTSTIFTSLSFIMAIYAIYSQRQHDRKSFHPIAYIKTENYLDNIAIVFSNHGTGPLIVEEFYFISETEEKFQAIIDYLSDKVFHITYSDFVESINGRSLPPSDSISLIRYCPGLGNQFEVDQRNKLKSLLSKCRIVIKYKNIYGDQMETYEKLLKDLE